MTTLGIGGDARYFVRATTEKEVAEAVRYASRNALPLFVLGGGSNVLVADEGFDGLVIQVGLLGVSAFVRMPDDTGEITAGAGEDWDRFVEHCVKHKLAGVECLSGIPGFVGGTPVQNVGAYGQEVSETILSVRVFDRRTNEIKELSNRQCGFSYRTSIFNSTRRDRFIVLAVTFILKAGGKPTVVYPELQKAMHASIYARWASETLRDGEIVSSDNKWLMESLDYVRYVVLAVRRNKSMVIDSDDPNSRSAGSFFKNPIVESEKLKGLQGIHPDIPFFIFGDGFKIPAAWLIETAGFGKGFESGNAGISTKHTLALINRGGAKAAEMIALTEEIQRAVSDQFDISLKPEPVFVGFE